MATYITREGDTVDAIAWNFYGATENRVVEQVLEANPGLADMGAQLRAVVPITLPAIERPAKVEGVRLWD